MRLVRPSQICACSGESRRGFLPKRMRSIRSGSGIHLAHNSAKLKIINLPKHYPVVKVRERTFGSLWRNLSVSLSVLRFALPAVRWSVSQCSRIRGTMVLQTQNGDSIWPSRRSHSTCARLGLCAPIFNLLSGAPGQSSCHHALPAWWRRGDSNSLPSPCKGDALPTELRPQAARKWWAILDSNQ